MVKVYCYSKCTTCKKALKWLTDNGIEISGNTGGMGDGIIRLRIE